ILQSSGQTRHRGVERNFSIQVWPPIEIEHATKAVPRTGIETEPRGVWLIFGRISALKGGQRHGSKCEIPANQFTCGVKQQGMPEVARDGFVTLAEFPGDGFVHGACQCVRSFVEENFKSVDTLIAYIVAGKREVRRD